MKYTLSYLIKGGERHESSWASGSDKEAILIAREHLLSKAADRAIRFTPILSCGETKHNLLPYYPHDDDMNYYDRRSGEERRKSSSYIKLHGAIYVFGKGIRIENHRTTPDRREK